MVCLSPSLQRKPVVIKSLYAMYDQIGSLDVMSMYFSKNYDKMQSDVQSRPMYMPDNINMMKVGVYNGEYYFGRIRSKTMIPFFKIHSSAKEFRVEYYDYVAKKYYPLCDCNLLLRSKLQSHDELRSQSDHNELQSQSDHNELQRQIYDYIWRAWQNYIF